MNVSRDALRKEVLATLRRVDASIQAVTETALARGSAPERFVDQHGSFVMPPLLLAKTQCLATLVALNDPRRT